LVNQFRSEMPMPLVGIGHSFGGTALTNLALMHPRLLSSLVLLDPVILDTRARDPAMGPAYQSTFRKDLWPSRAEAEAAFQKNKFYQSWDRRVFDRWCKFGIRETPTNLYPNEHGTVTLSTTKHQECFTFMRPSYYGMSEGGSEVLRRELVPDLNPHDTAKYPFYRPEPTALFRRLGEVRPSVLYIFGGVSDMSSAESRQLKEGKVKEIVLKGVGHLVAMEASVQCAEAAAPWLGQELEKLRVARREDLEWTKTSLVDKATLSQEWQTRIRAARKAVRGKI
jgi:pimeloyl-ACP methyl ester carboxylesterase